MTFEFPRRVLGELIIHQKGHPFKSKDYQGSGVPIVRVSNFTDNSIDISDLKFVSTEVAQDSQKVELKTDDVVIATVGSWPKNPASIVGKTICVPKEVDGALMNQNSVILRIKNRCEIDQKYLFIALKNKSFSEYLVSMAQGSANQASVTLSDIFSYELEWPSSEVRKEIVNIIDSKNKKIRLNQQTNQTLEQMAQAIFKSWFVDFDPVKAKIAALEAGGSEDDALLAAMQAIAGSALFATDAADADAQTQLARLQAEHPEQYATLRATAELFPSAMQESELGEIPEGWEVTDFGAVSVCFDKHRIPLSKAQRDKRKGHIPYYGATSVMDYVDEHIFDDIFLLLGEDGSVLQKDDTPFIQYIWGKAWVNNHAHVLQGKGNVSTEQILLFMKNQNIAPYVTGAVQLKLNQKNMNSIPFIKATDEVCIAFNLLLKPMFADLRNREDESRKLSSLRDTLLPKLLSGEIDVSALADNTEANA